MSKINKMFKKTKFNSKQKGFSLFLSLLIMSIAATIAFSVFEIFYLQVIMTGNVKDSQVAFYNADSGLECMYYWHGINNKIVDGVATNKIRCNNEDKTIDLTNHKTMSPVQFFYGPEEGCSSINIDYSQIDPVSGKTIQKFESFGRNRYLGSDCDTYFPRRVERGLEIEYK